MMHELKETSAHWFLSFMSSHFISVYLLSSACIQHLRAYTSDASVLHELEPPPPVSFHSWHLILSFFILCTAFRLHTNNIFSHAFHMLRCCTNSKILEFPPSIASNHFPYSSPCIHYLLAYTSHIRRGGGLGSRPKKMYGERLGDGVEYHLMSPTPRR